MSRPHGKECRGRIGVTRMCDERFCATDRASEERLAPAACREKKMTEASVSSDPENVNLQIAARFDGNDR